MLALSVPRPRQSDSRDLLFLGGMLAFCLGFCLVLNGLWAKSIVNEALAAPLGVPSPDATSHLSADLIASGALDAADWSSRIAVASQPAASASGQAELGADVAPLSDDPESRSFDTRDWLFIVSWQASRGEHGGMQAAAVAPSTSQGKQPHEATETVAWLLQS